MKKKANTYKKEIQFEIGENSLESLIELVDSGKGNELGIFKFENSGARGVSFGRGLSFHEIEGEGLPTEKDNRAHHQEFHINFDVRLSHDGNGNIELFIAQKGTGSHFKFPLIGLSATQANTAAIDFEQRINHFAILQNVYYLAWACYRKQDENAEKRNESYEKIMSNLETHFKNLLKRKHYKVIEESEKSGIKIVKSAPVERGRNPRTKAEIEEQKRKFLEELFNGFKDFRTNHRNILPKQKDLRPYIYKELADKEKKISEMLNYHKLSFTKLWQAFLSNPKKEDFLRVVTPIGKIGSN